MSRRPRRSAASSSVCSSTNSELVDLLSTVPEDSATVPTFALLPSFYNEDAGQAGAVHYLGENERAKYRLHVRDGLLVDGHGQLFSPQHEPKEYIYVLSEDGKLLCCTSKDDDGRVLHHSSLVAGAPVAAAGQLTACRGRLLVLSNESGHYAPPPSSLHTMVHVLASHGLEHVDLVQLDVLHREAYDAAAEAVSESDAHVCHPRAMHAAHKGSGAGPSASNHPSASNQHTPIERSSLERSASSRLSFGVSRAALAPPLARGSEQPSHVSGWVTLRVLLLKGGKRLLLLILPLWVFVTSIGPSYPIVANCTSVVSPPLFILGGIALTANDNTADRADGQPKFQKKVGLSCCFCITIQWVHRMRVCRDAAQKLGGGGWSTEIWIRALVVTLSTFFVYSATASVFLGRIKPWHAYRVAAIASIIVGSGGGLALRTLVGPDVQCPPASLSFPLSMVFYFECLALVLACTPGNRRRCLELLTVISLDDGVSLIQAHDDEADEDDDEDEDAVSCSARSRESSA